MLIYMGGGGGEIKKLLRTNEKFWVFFASPDKGISMLLTFLYWIFSAQY